MYYRDSRFLPFFGAPFVGGLLGGFLGGALLRPPYPPYPPYPYYPPFRPPFGYF
ncbi:hypothetical protein [Bacillus xiapuensis]|uniref:hypothetical protein n=1 Tax=Bacillus xiapuensis TaxID=2014075 RepID=UPI0018E21DC1|nr:hypothetical protein [Bacillus xiapuensis]